jgi:hypothetical protein
MFYRMTGKDGGERGEIIFLHAFNLCVLSPRFLVAVEAEEGGTDAQHCTNNAANHNASKGPAA